MGNMISNCCSNLQVKLTLLLKSGRVMQIFWLTSYLFSMPADFFILHTSLDNTPT